MGWRETWRETVESFVRELRGPGEPTDAGADDALARAIADARAEVTAVERDLHATEDRLGEEESAAELCRRRRELAERIGDRDTAAVAARFERRHEERAALLRRKRDVLHDERGLARTELNELLDFVRGEDAATGVQP